MMIILKKLTLQTGLLALMLFPFMTACADGKANANKVVEASNFSAVAALMESSKKVLLLEFHAEHCAYCRQLERDFLKPMQLNKEDQTKVIIRKLDVGSYQKIIDFDGQKIAAEDFAARYNVQMTPTMVFLDKNGNEIAERILGINTPSLFGGYIDDAVDKAVKKIRG
ncbi:MAG: Thioredoxin-related protein [uncultured Thiotrichaceae bacterium]|uniref:Thioredoxin-related protein n=1 Tax=uncultured Thiotrichaceae bacterium TaxID=298394 RepID=A0A6S6UFV2_9GAMM|nr:MAG: Thioredoxin-related protein [uncultured Thiotrichaceae bacterium]